MARDHNSLRTLLSVTSGYPLERVYFQTPDNLQMQYPCIRFERDDQSVKHGDNLPYNIYQGYTVTLIAYEPDSDVVSKLSALPLCSFDRHYSTSDLNHDVFTIYH